jgi:light-harvesting complex I chlorophyll a/b binding protein 4
VAVQRPMPASECSAGNRAATCRSPAQTRATVQLRTAQHTERRGLFISVSNRDPADMFTETGKFHAFSRISHASYRHKMLLRVAPTMPMTTPLVHRVSLTMKALSAKDLPGVTAPLNYFDPLGFCNGVDEGRIRFYREVELKHGRVAMLAALGFVAGENFHPLFGGNIDVPSYIAFQQTPLQEFWRYVMFAIGLLELVSVSSFEFPVAIEWSDGQRRVFPRLWQVRASHNLGDFGFDPMGLKPSTEAELKAMQSKELNNGRTAMIGIAGMVAQELASGAKLLG